MQNRIIKLTAPLSKEDIQSLKIGDVVELTGIIYTARDAAHKRIQENILNNRPQPIELENQIIFYVGPTPAKPGKVIGSAAPTTSVRMDKYVEMMLELGIVGMIGKGERSDYIPELYRKHCGVYFLSIGGASAMIANQIKECDVVAYEDLGTESIKRLYVENLRLIVGIDVNGRVFQDEQVQKYRIV
ncbi:FumA C-terminus/TtdB family hydratase beta subunit [Proteiniclasticum ruminis]|uniref:Fumarate hydratase subunit beta n=1 Tax=Proteiniclasticum ruminis TaxID=398199 RepID=A0A1G8HS20_9CLOT|nr:FumA C-terminus/TtdB family hydratase beta subunit [Proteiniclasticum ruminis]SDI09300.1 fumarate hydratase subunit beta [Proteiniclasticum ruminis]